ncbi:protein FAR1-RELATED SEQUENCE 3-like [Diospyros lotus]|uniref:protein FAR1-RELATED SEQUENCE 3-like n=1 Tax=Diospyros lotus TaxID=55363 RepID=UPI00225A0D50|nr:protein FAR1-RELATED SEQUENCE 3-like [Diospyros lotus]
MSDIEGNPIVLAESFEDNEETFVNNEEITKDNECTALEEESDLVPMVRRLRLGEGDATAIQAYFSKMQAFCLGFYFSVDLDEDGRLKNVFWADNRCVHEVVYESQSPEEFEQAWNIFIEKYALHDNDWLSRLYKERCRWVPYFVKTSFWARMSTTQRSEGMNAFFDGYVHSKTSLKQFVEQYEWAMRCKVEKEFQADVRSFSQMVPCVSRLAIEKQFQEVYTIAKFKEFQEELTGKIYCLIVFTEEGPLGMSCHMFEFKGIICRHAGTVLIQNGVRSILERYILQRWRRDVSRCYMRVKINYNGWINTPSQLRYDQLCSAFAKVADKVADAEEQTQTTMEWIQSQLNALSISNANPSYGGNIYAQHSVQEQVHSCGETATASSKQLMDLICSQRKGAPRKLRKKGPLETHTKKAKLVSWNAAHGVSMVPTSRTGHPCMPIYLPHLQPDDNPPEF